MAIPKINELYDPILLFLAEYGDASLSEIRSKFAQIFYILEEEATARKDKRYSLFEERVNNACFNLYYAGLIDRIYCGQYRLSESGEKTVTRGDYVDADYL